MLLRIGVPAPPAPACTMFPCARKSSRSSECGGAVVRRKRPAAEILKRTLKIDFQPRGREAPSGLTAAFEQPRSADSNERRDADMPRLPARRCAVPARSAAGPPGKSERQIAARRARRIRDRTSVTSRRGAADRRIEQRSLLALNSAAVRTRMPAAFRRRARRRERRDPAR